MARRIEFMVFTRLFFLMSGTALGAAIYWALGADGRGLTVVVQDMINQPWTAVTLIDLYLGFLISAAVIVLFERGWLLRFFWATPVFVLGNVWTALWLVIRLPEIARRMRSDK